MTDIYTCETTTSIKTEDVRHPQKDPHITLQATPPSTFVLRPSEINLLFASVD